MSYYRTCPYCGANLDPGERCDCQDNKKALVSVGDTNEGGVEQIETTASTSNDNTDEEDLQV